MIEVEGIFTYINKYGIEVAAGSHHADLVKKTVQYNVQSIHSMHTAARMAFRK